MLRRTWAIVHLDVLEENMRLLQNYVSPGCRIMGIVKADAYGHGAVAVAKRMAKIGITYFGVSNLEEAIELRRAGITQPMLILSYTPPCEAARLAEYAITQTVLSLSYAQELSVAAAAAGVTLTVHIKVDTGMSRVGFVCHDEAAVDPTAAEIMAACALPALTAEGIFMHFPSADEEDDGGFTKRQFALFMTLLETLEKEGVTFALRHCCNSAALVRYPEMHLDMVRPGIVQYGYFPDAWLKARIPGIQPVLELKTTVSMLKTLPAGTPLSYGRTFAADKPMTVATVPIGYADGYYRAMSNTAYMLVNGRPAPVVGRVCMDQCMLDVSAIDGVAVGSEATVLGAEALTADVLASWANTINYEVLCGVSRRVPRQYVDSTQVLSTVDYIMD